MIRTHDAGALRAEHVGQTVTLAGWVARRRDHGGVAFLDLREASGVAQVVVRDEALAHQLRAESCIAVTGEISTRPEGNQNPNLPTGDIEVIATDVEILGPSAPLPFPIDDHVEVGEEVRLAHRYLDLRRSGPAAAIRLRSKVNHAARAVLHERDFVEIETPTLTRSTPEGARDFLVPARLRPGSWYALPQSPQLFKQLLMVGGMERYYQIARCYRDEDFRADRQPEFTQLDVEMSFVDQDDVLELAEEILVALWRLIGHEISTPIPRMTYAEAMRRYGSDKPDLRCPGELVECTDFFADTPFRVFQAPYVGAVVMPGGASQPRKQLDAWQEWAKQRGARGLAYLLVKEDGELTGPVAKNISDDERAGIAAHVGAVPGDCIFFGAGAPEVLACAARRCAARDRPALPAPSTSRPGSSSGSSTRRSSSPPTRPPRPVTSPSAAAPGRPSTTPSPRRSPSRSTPSTPTPATRWPTPTTSSATATRSAVGRSVSTARTSRSGCSRSWGSARRRPTRSSASCCRPSSSAPRRTAASPSGGTGSVALLSGADSIRDVIAFPKSGGGYDPLTAAPAADHARAAQGGRGRRQAGSGAPHRSTSRPPARA